MNSISRKDWTYNLPMSKPCQFSVHPHLGLERHGHTRKQVASLFLTTTLKTWLMVQASNFLWVVNREFLSHSDPSPMGETEPLTKLCMQWPSQRKWLTRVVTKEPNAKFEHWTQPHKRVCVCVCVCVCVMQAIMASTNCPSHQVNANKIDL